MKCPVFEISLLIDLMLVKAGLQRDYSGLRNLSEKIQEELELGDRSQTQLEYIYRIDNNKIPTAISKQREEIEVSENNLNEYLDYIGYEVYGEFQEKINIVQEQIRSYIPEISKLSFLLPKSRKNQFFEIVKNSYHDKQEIQYTVADFDDSNEWEESFFQTHQGATYVWFIPPALFKSETVLETLRINQEQAHFIPIWLTGKTEDVSFYESVVDLQTILKWDGLEDDLTMLVQLLINSSLTIEKESAEKEKLTKQDIKGNTVVLGNMKVKGKYISGRDMYFQKIKSKDGES